MELEAKLKAARDRPGVDPSAHQREVEVLRSRIRELEAALRAAERTRAPDDLKRIRGIGPAFERSLAGLGVTSFAQIASWSAGDASRIAGQLGITPSRILSGRWIAQAAELASSR